MKTLCNFAICVMAVVMISGLSGCGNSQATTDELAKLQRENSDLKSDKAAVSKERDEISEELGKYKDAEAAAQKAAADETFKVLKRFDLSLIGFDSSRVNVDNLDRLKSARASLASVKGLAVNLFGSETETIRTVLANPKVLRSFYTINKSSFMDLLQHTSNLGHSIALNGLLLDGMQDRKKCRKAFQEHTVAAGANNTFFVDYQEGTYVPTPSWKTVLEKTGFTQSMAEEQYYAFLFYKRRLGEGGQPLVDTYIAILQDMNKELGN